MPALAVGKIAGSACAPRIGLQLCRRACARQLQILIVGPDFECELRSGSHRLQGSLDVALDHTVVIAIVVTRIMPAVDRQSDAVSGDRSAASQVERVVSAIAAVDVEVALAG